MYYGASRIEKLSPSAATLDMSFSRIAVVTGANKGIGLAIGGSSRRTHLSATAR